MSFSASLSPPPSLPYLCYSNDSNVGYCYYSTVPCELLPFFQCIFSLIFKLGNSYVLSPSLLILSSILSILLSSSFAEVFFFFQLLYFSILKLPFGSPLYPLSFTEIWSFLFASSVCTCSLKYFYHSYFKIFIRSFLATLLSQRWHLLILLFHSVWNHLAFGTMSDFLLRTGYFLISLWVFGFLIKSSVLAGFLCLHLAGEGEHLITARWK